MAIAATMARRLARWALRGVRAALAAVALAALVAWPWSYHSPGRADGQRWTVGTDRVMILDVGCAWEGGRVGIRRGVSTYTRSRLDSFRRKAVEVGPGWKWDWRFDSTLWAVSERGESWGPLRWNHEGFYWDGVVQDGYRTSLPCWLLACAAGAWPAGSVALFVRRRRRAARRARLNLCRRCGYDLRATPAAGGATLAVCPECGMAAAGAVNQNVETRMANE